MSGRLGLAAALCTAPALAVAQTTPPTAAPLTPQRSEAAETYLKTATANGLQVPILYLPPDAPLDAEPEEPEPDAAPGRSETVEWGATGVLVLLFLLFCLLLWLGRGQLADLLGPKNRKLTPRHRVLRTPDLSHADIDHDLIAKLKREDDPRVGLRMVLERFLALAAQDNAIVLKRSLTTRELVQRLPGGWAHREALELLARRTELVLFGGREISRDDYRECLDLAAPFLKRTAA